MPEQTSQQPKYVPVGIPAEKPSKYPGMIHGILSIVCAAAAVFFFPPIFGITGIILGNLAHKKGAKALGLVGIILSSICMAGGILLTFILS